MEPPRKRFSAGRAPHAEMSTEEIVRREVARQRQAERMREHMAKVEERRRAGPPKSVTVTWGKAGEMPVPRQLKPGEEPGPTGWVQTNRIVTRPVEAPPSRIIERVYVQQAPESPKPRGKPGPKPGKTKDFVAAVWRLAEPILNDPRRRPVKGPNHTVHREKLAEMIRPALHAESYENKDIVRELRACVRNWEEKNRDN